VYQQVRKLEEDLERKLFERVGRGTMQLTPPGRLLYDFAAPFFERLPAAVRAIQADSYGGTIRIHSASKVIEDIIPDWIASMLAERPDIEVEIHETGDPDADLLRSSTTDLIVDYVAGETPADMHVRQIGRVYGFLVVPSSHPLADKADLSLADLNHQPFVSYHRRLQQHVLQQRALDLYGVTPKYVAYLDQAEAILSMVSMGLGFSLVPSFSPEGPAREGIRSIALGLEEANFPIVAMWRREGPHNPLIDVALQYAPEWEE
jgi:DNA-binding transcriptional LysR family regulator